MKTPWLGCIADDYTGATDLSSMLVRAGLRVVQCFGTPDRQEDLDDADAIVVSLKSRSIPADEAVELSLGALQFLQRLGTERFFFKYCSTFDSTARGNIGPVADALANELDADNVLFCPAFPENGRTVYCANLFVAGVPLAESGMRDHPLNPMTDSNLVRVLQAQSSRHVAFLGLGQELKGSQDRLGEDRTGTSGQHFIVDAIDNEHLRRVATLARDHRLLTGGSAIARYWAEALAEDHAGRGRAASRGERAETSNATKAAPARSVVLAGSCSDATRTQIAEFASRFPVLYLNVQGDHVKEVADTALAWCDEQWASTRHAKAPLLISSSADVSLVEAARQRWGEQRAAELVERMFGAIASGLVERGIGRLIVAGGETSGAVINALQIKAIRIGREIAPGVPLVESLGSPNLLMALKSGNFGGPRFFFEALECEP